MLVPQTFCTKSFLASPGACIVASSEACVAASLGDVMHHSLYDASPEACVVASPGDVMHHLLYDASPEMSITHISCC